VIGFADKILAYTAGLDQDRFVREDLIYDATLRNLELIDEAATHIPESVRTANPDIPWRLVVASRNRLIRGSSGIDNDMLWSIVRDNVSALPARLRELRDRLAS